MRIFLYEYACALSTRSGIPDSIVREGRAMRDALARDLAQAGARLLTLDAVPREQEYEFFCQCLCKADAAWIIAPELERILVARCQWTEQAGVRLLGTPVNVLRWLTDKWQQYVHLKQFGVPVPESWEKPPPGDVGPCVCKPRFGAGSYRVQWWRVVQDTTPTFGSALSAQGGSFLWQEYVPGQPASIACLCGVKQRIVLRAATQRLSQDGSFRYLGGSLPLAEPLETRARRLAEMVLAAVPQLRGYIGIDLVLGTAADGSRDYVIEINPRLTTSYVGQRALCQQNLAELTLRLLQGENVSPPTWKDKHLGFDSYGNLWQC